MEPRPWMGGGGNTPMKASCMPAICPFSLMAMAVAALAGSSRSAKGFSAKNTRPELVCVL
jgi:hypothetical protein